MVAQPESIEDQVVWMTMAEEVASFDRLVAKLTGLATAEFLERLDAGEWDEVIDDPEYRHILELALMADVVR